MNAQVDPLSRSNRGSLSDACNRFFLVGQRAGCNRYPVTINAPGANVVDIASLNAGVGTVDQPAIGQGVGDRELGCLPTQQLARRLVVQVAGVDSQVLSGLDSDRVCQCARGLQLQVATSLQGARQGMVALQMQAYVTTRGNLSCAVQAGCAKVHSVIGNDLTRVVADVQCGSGGLVGGNLQLLAGAELAPIIDQLAIAENRQVLACTHSPLAVVQLGSGHGNRAGFQA